MIVKLVPVANKKKNDARPWKNSQDLEIIRKTIINFFFQQLQDVFDCFSV